MVVQKHPTTKVLDSMEVVLAYIDPGSGSLIIQGIIAALVAVPVLFRNQIRRFANKVRGTDATDLTAPVATDGETNE